MSKEYYHQVFPAWLNAKCPPTTNENSHPFPQPSYQPLEQRPVPYVLPVPLRELYLPQAYQQQLSPQTSRAPHPDLLAEIEDDRSPIQFGDQDVFPSPSLGSSADAEGEEEAMEWEGTSGSERGASLGEDGESTPTPQSRATPCPLTSFDPKPAQPILPARFPLESYQTPQRPTLAQGNMWNTPAGAVNFGGAGDGGSLLSVGEREGVLTDLGMLVAPRGQAIAHPNVELNLSQFAPEGPSLHQGYNPLDSAGQAQRRWLDQMGVGSMLNANMNYGTSYQAHHPDPPPSRAPQLPFLYSLGTYNSLINGFPHPHHLQPPHLDQPPPSARDLGGLSGRPSTQGQGEAGFGFSRSEGGCFEVMGDMFTMNGGMGVDGGVMRMGFAGAGEVAVDGKRSMPEEQQSGSGQDTQSSNLDQQSTAIDLSLWPPGFTEEIVREFEVAYMKEKMVVEKGSQSEGLMPRALHPDFPLMFSSSLDKTFSHEFGIVETSPLTASAPGQETLSSLPLPDQADESGPSPFRPRRSADHLEKLLMATRAIEKFSTAREFAEFLHESNLMMRDLGGE